MLFVIRPNDDNPRLRLESLNFIEARLTQAQYEVNATEGYLTKAYATADDAEDGDYRAEQAEDRYATACALLRSCQHKLAFEKRDAGRPRIKPDPKMMPHPWRDDPAGWARIFRHRNNRDS